jgi:hypothetical protein
MKTSDRNVAKDAFPRLKDNGALEQVASGAADEALRIAAEVKLGKVGWPDVFARVVGPKASPRALGNALAAVSLSPDPGGIDRLVTDACLRLIRRGDESRIPELAELLQGYGDKTLCEDYLNCGQPDLEKAGRDWARKRGYNIGSGYGSNRARWGSERGHPFVSRPSPASVVISTLPAIRSAWWIFGMALFPRTQECSPPTCRLQYPEDPAKVFPL